jgi:hypothetical protein
MKITSSPILITSVLTTPTTPSTGFIAIYPKADGNLYMLLSNGTEIKLN